MKYWLWIVFFLFIVQIASAEENLVGYWKFESVNLTNYTEDSSGNGNDGKLINFSANPPTTVVGRIGRALQFDGVNDYINIDNSSSLNFGTGSFTIEAWIKTVSANNPIIRKDNDDSGPRWLIKMESGILFGYIGNETMLSFNSSASLNDSNWHYIVLVFSRNQNARIYVDGVQRGNATDISGLGSISNVENLLIGKGSGETYFNGTLDEVKIWNKSLTTTEVWENYFGKRTNPIVLPDVSEVSGSLNQNYTFNIVVTNMDNQSYGNSVFKLISNCPTECNCSISPINQTISPGNSSSYSLTIKPFIVTEEKTLVNVTAINMNNTNYNTTIRVGFILGSKCDKASVKVSDVYFYENTSANVTVENNGNSSLKIKSAIITDKSGKTYGASKLPTGLDVGKKEYIIFTNISNCENFSKIVISTDCPVISASFIEARCQVKPAIVKIRSVEYENDTVKIELRNDGSGTIDSSSIKMLIDDKSVSCKQNFQLAPKNIEECDIIDFVCGHATAKLKITSPNVDEKEFECLRPILITAKVCIDAYCNELSETFVQGKKLYLNVETAPEADVTAIIILSSGEEQSINITQPFKPKEAGDYIIKLTASKEGYKDTISEVEFTVIKSGGFPIKIVLIVLGVVILTGAIVFYINHRKNKQFEKLYQKYGRPSPQTRAGLVLMTIGTSRS